MLLDDDRHEAARQLAICNSCRYCEGYCAVFPAIERRNLFEGGDITQIANLCHDCRACLDACMYAPPHEFAVNIPLALSRVRSHDYERFAWPGRRPRLLADTTAASLSALTVTGAVVAIALATRGTHGLIGGRTGAASPYSVMPYWAVLAVVLAPTVFCVTVLLSAGIRYWRATASDRAPGRTFRAVPRALYRGLVLRNLRGGGAGCHYPDREVPSPLRRRAHGLVVAGIGCCLVSTASAAVLQDVMSERPPYPLVSVPVTSGTLGGVLLVVGSTILLRAKMASPRELADQTMVRRDYGLLVALEYLALSGLATLLARSTSAFGLIFVAHISAVAFAFAVIPYSKLAHALYRSLALVRDRVEESASLQTTSAGRPG